MAARPIASPRVISVLRVGFLLMGFATVTRAELSDKTRAEIAAAFPQFASHPAKATLPDGIRAPAPLSDDPLELLPVYHISEARFPKRDPDIFLSRRAKDDKAMIEYSESMTNLEWALNSWHVPLPFGYSLTPSTQARANTAHAERKIIKEYKKLSSLVSDISAVDSVEGKKLLHDLDLDAHPGR